MKPAAPAPVTKEEPKVTKTEEPPRRRERPKVEPEPEPEPPRTRLGKSDRNDILEQMKRLQEGYQLDVDEEDDDISYSLSEDDDADEEPERRTTRNVIPDKIEDEDLEDMDLLDPFGDEPVPVPKKKDVSCSVVDHLRGSSGHSSVFYCFLTFVCLLLLKFILRNEKSC